MVKKQHKILRKKTIYSKGPICLVSCDFEMPDGRILSRQILEHPGCVVIIPKTASGRFILVRQYRFPLREHLWEFPAGGREEGESFAIAAKRELMEEIGMRPGKLQKVLEFFPTPGVSAEKMHVFLASKLHEAFAPKDDDEEFEVREFSLTEIGKMIRKKEIVDGKTLVGFFYLKNRKNR